MAFDCGCSLFDKKLPNSSLLKRMFVTASVLRCYVITSVLYKSHHPSQVHYEVPTDGILKSEDGGIYGQQRDSEKKILLKQNSLPCISESHLFTLLTRTQFYLL